ncbi:MAG: FMN-binding negative transcriptional regulator [Candidatus Eremiobacteraeota bacterium]|nr:FMN-binding negative transcriptional regulator [Candidatus Eremiobacteraeota bacterium]
MYVPPAFAVADREFALRLIERYPFGILVTPGVPFLQATHLPMLAHARGDDLWIVGHVARANPQARAIEDREAGTALFSGPHAYVSPAWYASPSTSVPTWNYTAVHAAGRLVECDGAAVVALLTEAFERERPVPWRLETIDPDYYGKQLRGIVAFEMRVEALTCAAKLSQNRSADDRAAVIDALAQSPRPLDRDCARAMQG